MCASGIPEPTPTHAPNALLMGLGMLKDVERSNAERAAKGTDGMAHPHRHPYRTGGDRRCGREEIRLRHLGRYGEPGPAAWKAMAAGQLNISGVTYAQVMDYVEVVPRGPIKVKGKASCTCTWQRLKPHPARMLRGP
ncbi:MAG: hypothetical protein IPH60_04745 [Flavobacteriales bacterium]|nr:hypothetical protein [Flavobacteriales bacterium]